MTDEFVLNAVVRQDAGKGASRRLRRNEGQVPAIIYGGEKDPLNIQFAHKDLVKQLENEAFYSHVVTINVGNDSEPVLLKDLQRHPSRPQILHADFLRVSMDKEVTVKVPLHFLNEEACIGVKMQGGKISHVMTELEISCLPAKLPEYIEVDLAKVEVDQIVHISDIQLPEGVVSTALALGEDHDGAVATVHVLRGSTAEDEESESADEGEPTGEESGEE